MGLTGLDPLKDLHLRDIDLVEEFRRLKFLKESFANFVCVNCPKFTECVSIFSCICIVVKRLDS